MATATKSGGVRATCGGRGGATPEAIRTYLPENLDLKQTGIKPGWRDYAAFVVGGLYLRRHLEMHREAGDFYPLSSRVLKEVLPPRDYRAILAALSGAGVVECRLNAAGREAYRPGVESKGYRLTAGYRDAPFKAVDLSHPELVRKVRAGRQRRAERPGGVHAHLRAAFDRVEVVVGYPTSCLALRLLADRTPHFSVCPQGRVHTPLTSLNREFRGLVRVGGRPLWQLDVVNSQPFLMGLTLQDRGLLTDPGFVAYQEFLAESSSPNRGKISSLPIQPSPNSTFTTRIPYVAPYSDGRESDFGRYIGLCREGRVYEHLGELTGYGRDEVKENFYLVAFGRPARTRFTKMGKVFRSEFPSVWAEVCLDLPTVGGQ